MKNSENFIESIRKEILKISNQASKKKIKSAFVISTTSKRIGKNWVMLPTRETKYAICGAITVYDLNTAKKITKYIDSKVDYILIDAEIKLKNFSEFVKQISKYVTKSKILLFKNNDLTASSADILISKIYNDISDKKISIIGAGNIGSKLSLKLAERGAKVYLASEDIKKTKSVTKCINSLKSKYSTGTIFAKDLQQIAKNTDLLIGLTPISDIINSKMIQAINDNGIIIDGGVGNISRHAIKEAAKKGIQIIRLDTRAGFAGEISMLFETEKLLEEIQGKAKLNGIEVVAGGIYGKNGAVVLDNILKPKKVLGIADGKGGILHQKLSSTNLRNLKFVTKLVDKGKQIHYD